MAAIRVISPDGSQHYLSVIDSNDPGVIALQNGGTPYRPNGTPYDVMQFLGGYLFDGCPLNVVLGQGWLAGQQEALQQAGITPYCAEAVSAPGTVLSTGGSCPSCTQNLAAPSGGVITGGPGPVLQQQTTNAAVVQSGSGQVVSQPVSLGGGLASSSPNSGLLPGQAPSPVTGGLPSLVTSPVVPTKQVAPDQAFDIGTFIKSPLGILAGALLVAIILAR